MPTIETTEFIQARPEAIWRILTDLESYAEWNPFIVEAAGRIEAGEKLELRMQPPAGKAMTFRPTVLKAEPGQELRWLGRLPIPGLFDGEHYFQLEPEGEGTRLRQGENFSGILPRFMSKTLARTELGFIELNAALKRRAESGVEAPDR